MPLKKTLTDQDAARRQEEVLEPTRKLERLDLQLLHGIRTNVATAAGLRLPDLFQSGEGSRVRGTKSCAVLIGKDGDL